MVIGVCGCGYAGTAAVVDYLSEIDSLRLNRATGYIYFEYNIAHCYDGLLDLEHHLCNQIIGYTGYESGDVAIRRFSNCMKEFVVTKCNDTELGRKCLELTKEYLNSIIQVRWKGNKYKSYGFHVLKPEPCVCQEDAKKTWEKSLSEELFTPVIGKKGSVLYYYNRARRKLSRMLYPINVDIEHELYLSVSPDDFLSKTRKFVEDVINLMIPGDGDKVVLKQCFPYNDPVVAFRYFSDPKAIVMWRDPRDLFAIWKYQIKRRAFAPVDNVVDYVKYMEIVLGNTKQAKYEPDQVLNVWYEDLIFHYDETTRVIDEFIGVEHTKHENRRFKPEVSRKNARLFEVYSEGKEEFDYIAEHLKEFLYPYENL